MDRRKTLWRQQISCHRSDYAFDPKGIGYSYRRFGLFWGNKIALGVESGTPDFNYYGLAYQISSHVRRRRHRQISTCTSEQPLPVLWVRIPPTIFLSSSSLAPNLKFGLLAGHLPNTRGIRWMTLGAAFQFRQVLFASDIAIPRSGPPRPLFRYRVDSPALPIRSHRLFGPAIGRAASASIGNGDESTTPESMKTDLRRILSRRNYGFESVLRSSRIGRVADMVRRRCESTRQQSWLEFGNPSRSSD